MTGDSAVTGAESGQLGQVIANHVRTRRLEMGLNVGQLAERTGISKGMLSKIENAQTSPSLSTLERLAGALDMPVTSLFRGLSEERDAVFVKAGVVLEASTILGSRIVKVEPRPGSLSTVISPPIIWQKRRLITRPRPVPPYLLAVEEEAWENSWNSLPI